MLSQLIGEKKQSQSFAFIEIKNRMLMQSKHIKMQRQIL